MIARCMRDYALVAGVCLIINNAILIAIDWTGAPLASSIGASFVVCAVVGYVLHSRVSFRRNLEVGAFARYVVAMSANVPLTFAALWLWRDFAALRIEIAAPLASISTTLVNFVLCRFAVFGRRDVRTPLLHP